MINWWLSLKNQIAKKIWFERQNLRNLFQTVLQFTNRLSLVLLQHWCKNENVSLKVKIEKTSSNSSHYENRTLGQLKILLMKFYLNSPNLLKKSFLKRNSKLVGNFNLIQVDSLILNLGLVREITILSLLYNKSKVNTSTRVFKVLDLPQFKLIEIGPYY